VSEREADPNAGHRGPAVWRGRAIVWLRFPLIAAWIAALILASANLPAAFEGESASLKSLLPSSSQALEVEQKAVATFGFPLISRSIVVAEDERGFNAAQGAAALRFIARVDTTSKDLRAVPYAEGHGPPAAADLGKTLLVYLYPAGADVDEAEINQASSEFAAGLGRASGAETSKLTGALPASAAETGIVNEHLLWVEIATVVLVVGILALYFRSVGVPLLCLAGVALSYLASDRLLGLTAEHFNLAIPEEVEPVIIALLFGVVTDYLVFFVSGFRLRLAAGARAVEAASEVTGELLPVVCTAALMIAGATMTLSLSGVAFLSAFGPAMAISVLVGAAVSLTFIPACLAIFGRFVLWPHRLDPVDEDEDGAEAGTGGARGRVVGFAARHPLLVGGLCVVALLAGASGLRKLELGNPIIRGLPDTSTVKQAYNGAAAAFGPGVLGPTMLVVEGPGVGEELGALSNLQGRLEDQPGIAGVLGPAQQPIAEPKGPFLAPDGSAARFALVLDADPDGPVAPEILERLESRLPVLIPESGLGEASTGVTGDTTIGNELTEGTWHAGLKVAPIALAILLFLLWVLLRSRSAPLYLVGSSLLVVAAALGLTVYVFQGLLGYNELAFFVPVATAILLLALGADYNVFLVSRIWDEARRQDLQMAIRTAGSRASSAITVAGLILALSFGAVWLIPIVAFRELAFALFVGLLLDTWLARTLLIPSLVSLFGGERRREDPDPAQEKTGLVTATDRVPRQS
jgi:RND superfamily putative drug exporter